jgi:esterase/lipase superfamily enzyme
MGAYVLRHAVQRLRHLRPARLFEEVLLFAPDEDDDAFEEPRKLQPLERLCRRITLYHNRGDTALTASDWTKANPDRLGQHGLHNTRLSPDKVVSVDCSALAGMRHDYHLTVTAVQADLLAVLQGTPTEAIANRVYVPHRATFRLLR